MPGVASRMPAVPSQSPGTRQHLLIDMLGDVGASKGFPRGLGSGMLAMKRPMFYSYVAFVVDVYTL